MEGGTPQFGRQRYRNLLDGTLGWRRGLTGSESLRLQTALFGLSLRRTDGRRSLSSDHLGTATKIDKFDKIEARSVCVCVCVYEERESTGGREDMVMEETSVEAAAMNWRGGRLIERDFFPLAVSLSERASDAARALGSGTLRTGRVSFPFELNIYLVHLI